MMVTANNTAGSAEGDIPSAVLEMTVTGVGKSAGSVGKTIERATDSGDIENLSEALGAAQDKFGGDALSTSVFMT
jgi:hypothetical protein